MKGNKLCLCFLLAAGVGLGAHAQNKIAAPNEGCESSR